jgi:uncharacterized protein (DUF885 family)
MWRFLHSVLAGAAALALAACGPASAPPPVPPAPPATAFQGEPLAHLVQAYWDEYLRLNPRRPPPAAAVRYDPAGGYDISEQFLADSLAMQRRYLEALRAVPRPAAGSEARLTYDIFERERELDAASFTYPSELLPVNPFRSLPLEFARSGAGADQYAILSAKDYDNWQGRADDYVRWTGAAIERLREGMRRGYTLPRVLVDELLPMLAALGEDTPANVFYQPLRSIPATLPESERKRFADGIAARVKHGILPAYRELHDFLRDEYRARARDSVGLSVLPLGQSWYAFLIKRETASGLAPAEIHALGLAETQRLHARLLALLTEAGFAGSAQAFYEAARREPHQAFDSPDALLEFYGQFKAEAAAALPQSFTQLPQADFAIRRVEAFREATAPALAYRRQSNRNYPAVLYVNVSQPPLAAQTAPFLREALPGHHLQLATQEERSALPSFRRFGGDPAFVEGWGLYAESLGEELGLYRDTESKFTALSDQLLCAAGLVIDTGLHALGWSRARALDYLRAQAPIDEAAARNAVDRAIALPGEALACGMGARMISGLRAQAEQALGPRFDVREFHAELLGGGAMPLDILESTVRSWLNGPH